MTVGYGNIAVSAAFAGSAQPRGGAGRAPGRVLTEEEHTRALEEAFQNAHLGEQSYASFLSQFPTIQVDPGDVPVPITGIPEAVVGEKSSLEGLYGEEANAAMRREYEAAAPTPEAEEATESAVAVLVDEHGVAIENLPKGTNSGFFLDAPSKVQMGNFVDDDDVSEEEGCWEDGNQYFMAGGLARASPRPASITDAMAAVSMNGDGQVSELDKQTRGILTVEDMIIPPPVSKSTLEEIPDTEDTESSPFQDGKGLKQMRGVPGLVGEELEEEDDDPIVTVEPAEPTKHESDDDDDALQMVAEMYNEADARDGPAPHLSRKRTILKSSTLSSPAAAGDDTDEDVSSFTAEGEDAVKPFALDPDFDYDNVELTPHPITAMRKEWLAANPQHAPPQV